MSPAFAAARERVEGAGGAQLGQLLPVRELQQLDRPLDVGEPAAAELGVLLIC